MKIWSQPAGGCLRPADRSHQRVYLPQMSLIYKNIIVRAMRTRTMSTHELSISTDIGRDDVIAIWKIRDDYVGSAIAPAVKLAVRNTHSTQHQLSGLTLSQPKRGRGPASKE